MRLVFIGTGWCGDESSPTHEKNSSLLIEHNGKKILIDWGEDYKDEKVPDVDWVLLTHAHSGHIGAADKLVDKKITMNKTCADKLKNIKFKHLTVIKDKEVEEFKLGPFEVTAIPAIHSINAPMTCYKIAADDTIFYAPNVLWIRDRTKHFKGVNVYIGDATNQSRSIVGKHEEDVLGHASILAQLKWCSIEDVTKVIFTHFGKDTMEDGDEKSIRLLTEKFSNGVKFLYAHDGMEFDTKSFTELQEIIEILAIEETENEVRARIRSPGNFAKDSFRRGPFPPGKPARGVFAIYACPKGKYSGGHCQVGVQIQALRFVKKEGWTITKARAWLKAHGFTVVD